MGRVERWHLRIEGPSAWPVEVHPSVGLSCTLPQLNDVALGVASIAHREARTLPCWAEDESAQFLSLLLGRCETCNSEERLDGLFFAEFRR